MENLLLRIILLSLAFNSSQEKPIELRLLSSSPTRGSSAPLKLQCTSTSHQFLDHGVFWFRQLAAKEPPQFFLHFFIKPKWADGFDEKKFKVYKESASFCLEIRNFCEEDQGDYYCLIYKNTELHFSGAAPLYYPQVTAPATTSKYYVAVKGSNNCTCPTAPTTVKPLKKASLDFPCSLYILVPLAAVSLVFLIAFLVTINFLCKILIRRKRCKHHNVKRPMNENNARPNVPNRYV